MIEPGRPVKDISISKDSEINQIFQEMAASGGFESRNITEGLEILSSMIENQDCL